MGVRLRVAVVESVIPNSGKTVCVWGGGGGERERDIGTCVLSCKMSTKEGRKCFI